MEHSYKKIDIRILVQVIFLIGLVFVAFFQVRGFSFLNFDDNEYVTANPNVSSGVSWDNVKWAFSRTVGGHWHPLTFISHMIDCSLFGLNPGAHHLVNVTIHAFNTGLLFILLTIISGRGVASLLVAMIFGLHPMRIESVAWIAERKDVLSMFFALLSSIAYVKYANSRRYLTYLLAAILFVLGLLSKPTILTLPLLFLLLDGWPLGRFGNSSYKEQNYRIGVALVVEKLPLLLLSLLSCLITSYAQNISGGLKSLDTITLDARMANVAVSYLAYFGKLFLPLELGIFYPFTDYSPGVGVGAFSGLVGITVGVLAYTKRRPYLLFGWLWFLISLSPMIGFIPFGGQSYADRWSYLPHIGLLIATVWLAEDLLIKNKDGRRNGPLYYKIIWFALPLVCFAKTYRELPNWSTSESLFAHTIEVSPDNFLAENNLGVALDQTGKLAEATKHFEEAVRLNPTYPEALNNLGSAVARNGNVDQAVALFNKALSVRPNFLMARYHLGLSNDLKGRHLIAVAEWLKILSTNSEHREARASLEYSADNRFPDSCEETKAAGIGTSKDEVKQFRAAMLEWHPAQNDPLYLKLSNVLSCLEERFSG